MQCCMLPGGEGGEGGRCMRSCCMQASQHVCGLAYPLACLPLQGRAHLDFITPLRELVPRREDLLSGIQGAAKALDMHVQVTMANSLITRGRSVGGETGSSTSTTLRDLRSAVHCRTQPPYHSLQGVLLGLSLQGVLLGLSLPGVLLGLSLPGVLGLSLPGVLLGLSLTGVLLGLFLPGVLLGLSLPGVLLGLSLPGVLRGTRPEGWWLHNKTAGFSSGPRHLETRPDPYICQIQIHIYARSRSKSTGT